MEREELGFDPDEIQGDVVPGFRRGYQWTFEQAFVFASFENPDGARAALTDLVDEVSWASDVHRRQNAGSEAAPSRPYLNIAFTRHGIEMLLPDLGEDDSYSAFNEGLSERSREEQLLGAPEAWRIGRSNQDVHVVLNIGSSSDILHHVLRFESALGPSAEILYRAYGATLPGGIEHFGFRDGLSQPAIARPGQSNTGRATRSSVPAAPPPGERATYVDRDELQREYEAALQASLASDSVDESAARAAEAAQDRHEAVGDEIEARRPLVPASQFIVDPEDTGFWANGSFMVWLQLQQYVHAFRHVCRRLAARLTQEWGRIVTADDAGALLMGRRRDGTSLAQASLHDTNEFSYLQQVSVPADVYGVRCPLGAHARKMNPRITGFTDQLILRRGIPYGPLAPDGYDDQIERGLLFVCYQSNIEDQFETLQGTWANKTNEPEKHAFVDVIISEESRAGTTIEIPNPDTLGSVLMAVENDWVVPRGGIYLFVPSKAGLNSLISGKMPDKVAAAR